MVTIKSKPVTENQRHRYLFKFIGVECGKIFTLSEDDEPVNFYLQGLIWAQQPNGAIFTFPPQAGKVTEVSQPAQEMRPFVCMSATSEAVWGLTNEAKVYIRKGMASHCPHGLTWVSLDLMQLGEWADKPAGV